MLRIWNQYHRPVHIFAMLYSNSHTRHAQSQISRWSYLRWFKILWWHCRICIILFFSDISAIINETPSVFSTSLAHSFIFESPETLDILLLQNMAYRIDIRNFVEIDLLCFKLPSDKYIYNINFILLSFAIFIFYPSSYFLYFLWESVEKSKYALF